MLVNSSSLHYEPKIFKYNTNGNDYTSFQPLVIIIPTTVHLCPRPKRIFTTCPKRHNNYIAFILSTVPQATDIHNNMVLDDWNNNRDIDDESEETV